MADIAMLVAEEYERRIKLARKSGDPFMEKSLLSVLGDAPNQVISSSSSIKWIPSAKTLFQHYQATFNPTTPMAIAALESSFSA